MSAPTGLVMPPAGAQMPWVESAPALVATAGAHGANEAYLYMVRVSAPLTVTQMTYYVGTASGYVDMGVYRSDGTTATRLSSTGSTTANGTNTVQTIALTSSVTLVPGTAYYLAIAFDNGTVTSGRINTASANFGNATTIRRRVLKYNTSFPLPATFTIASALTFAFHIWIMAD